jgi:uncharacterized protein DUF6600
MITTGKWIGATLLGLALVVGAGPGQGAAQPPSAGPAGAIGRTPPRMSYIDGEVSFWRPGAQDWASAQLNVPLAPGDELYTGHQGDVELEVGTRAFVRAWGDTHLGVANQEPDFLQFTVTSGHVALDLRSLDPGRGVELNTPHAAVTIAAPGYYRADVTEAATSFITRRAGRATVTPADGGALAVTPSEEVVVQGPAVQSYVAPELDAFDEWNYARTDHLLEAVSARYVPAEVYGLDDLDHYGAWRVVQPYGPVWIPEEAPAGWVPYSTGRWMRDPYYGWTWVDTAPWGWAPYHYGRWVFVDGLWAWAPGPIVARPVYAPALVAFFGAPGIEVTVGAPVVSWVALGWGEPVVPWWGPPGYSGRPRWAGWGGPRVVNNVVINRTTNVNVTNITVYRNVTVQNAVVAVRQDHFGGHRVEEARVAQIDPHRLQPVRGPVPVRSEAPSAVPEAVRGARPPEALLTRPVVATRPPAVRPLGPHDAAQPAPAAARAPRIVAKPRPAEPAAQLARPSFGASEVERPRPARPPALEPQRSEAPAPGESVRGPEASRPVTVERAPGPEPRPPAPGRGPAEPAPPSGSEARRAAAPPPPRVQAPPASTRPLPGEPANRLSPSRTQVRPVPGHPGPPPPAPAHGREPR